MQRGWDAKYFANRMYLARMKLITKNKQSVMKSSPPPLLFRVGRRNRNLENKWRLRNKITNWQNVYHSFHFLCVLPLFSFSPRHFVACKILVLSLPRLKPITIFCYLTHTTVHHFLPSTLILHAAYYQRLNLGLNWAWSEAGSGVLTTTFWFSFNWLAYCIILKTFETSISN